MAANIRKAPLIFHFVTVMGMTVTDTHIGLAV